MAWDRRGRSPDPHRLPCRPGSLGASGAGRDGQRHPEPGYPGDPTTNVVGTLDRGPQPRAGDAQPGRAGVPESSSRSSTCEPSIPTGRSRSSTPADPNAANCDPSTFVIENLTADALGRLNRFIRLWRQVGCAMWELDLVLPDVNAAPNVVDKPITDRALQQVSRLDRLRDGADPRLGGARRHLPRVRRLRLRRSRCGGRARHPAALPACCSGTTRRRGRGLPGHPVTHHGHDRRQRPRASWPPSDPGGRPRPHPRPPRHHAHGQSRRRRPATIYAVRRSPGRSA